MTVYRTKWKLEFTSQDGRHSIPAGTPVRSVPFEIGDGVLVVKIMRWGQPVYAVVTDGDLEPLPDCTHSTLDKCDDTRTRYVCRECGERLILS